MEINYILYIFVLCHILGINTKKSMPEGAYQKDATPMDFKRHMYYRREEKIDQSKG